MMQTPHVTLQTARQRLFAQDAMNILRTAFNRPQQPSSRTPHNFSRAIHLSSRQQSTAFTPFFSRGNRSASSPLRSARRYNSNNAHKEPPFPKMKYQAPGPSPSSASTSSSSSSSTGATKSLSLSERMKAMSQKYGWAVVGIYLGLSALDFPFCFLAVRWFGPERIGHLEHLIVSHVWAGLEAVVPGLKEKRLKNELAAAAEEGGAGNDDIVGVGSAQIRKTADDAAKGESASIWTQLLLAYGVHKSLFFLRIPITLAITPRVVKTLRSWGWKIGKVAPK